MAWTKNPTLYEINTFTWLEELERKYQRPFFLGNIPVQEWDALSELGIDAVWLMGVWERSPASRRIALANPDQVNEFKQALADFRSLDVLGSAYSIHRYRVDRRLGGPKGLAAARQMLIERGIRLVLDFVPNHAATDHPWIKSHPEYFIQGSMDDLRNNPQNFFYSQGRVIACGRDPYFPPWRDVAQLNAFSPGYRQASITTLSRLAEQCDGVRCDMAMLLMTEIFLQTWGKRAGDPFPQEYWTDVISAVHAKNSDFQFMAEVYWDKEYTLQQMGFSFCYDKKLYDLINQRAVHAVRAHLGAGVDYQEKLIRFIENHDERRAAAVFNATEERAAALAVLTLPGARLIYHGQLQGYHVRVPVFLRRGPPEVVDVQLRAWYQSLLSTIHATHFLEGDWALVDCDSHGHSLLAWCWRNQELRALVVINFSAEPTQGVVKLPLQYFLDQTYVLAESFSRLVMELSGREFAESGLSVNITPWGTNLYLLNPNSTII